MKLYPILPTITVFDPVKPSEFAFQSKFVTKHLPQLTYETQVPAQPSMPTSHPNLAKDAGSASNQKFLSEVHLGDKEMVELAYKNAVAGDVARTVERRRAYEAQLQKDAHNDNLDSNAQNIAHRVMTTWMQRFHMEKMFKHLRIQSMDQFKLLMHQFNVDHDTTQKVQYKLFLRQNGDDPAHMPPIITWNRISGKDFEIARIKLDLEHKDLRGIHEMRDRLAEQQAALAFTAAQTMQSNLVDWQKDLQGIKKINDEFGESRSKAKKIG